MAHSCTAPWPHNRTERFLAACLASPPQSLHPQHPGYDQIAWTSAEQIEFVLCRPHTGVPASSPVGHIQGYRLNLLWEKHRALRMGDRIVLERILSGFEKPTNLALALLQEITENFSEMRKIGEGGFGEVYKGVLHNRIIAVKRIIVSEHTIDDRLFDREVKNLMKIISHRNVVRFLGFCSNTHREAIKEEGSTELVLAQMRERLLCFEYISNRSLDKHITDELRGLEWSIRYEIIKGICHGLHYLHEEKNIIHMDLKPGNIMIDEDMVPKITDFGLSRLDKHTHTSGTRYITQGYCAPEYVNGGKTSKKADMYSLGVILTELITGLKGDPENVNISLYSDDMLGIKPLELRFLFERQKQISSVVKLINKTKDYYAFNIETPSQQYCAQPNKGIVCPQSKCTIQITMQMHETTPQDMPYTDDFIVQSTKVDGDLRAGDITDVLFNKEPGKVDEVILTVVVYLPEKSKGDLKSREDTKKKRNMVEYAFSKDKPGVGATMQSEDINSIGYKDVRGQCTGQPEHHSFHAAPSMQTKMSNRVVDLATGAMGSLLYKLGDLLKEEYNLEIGAKTDIEYFSDELLEMQLALCKVSEVQRDNLNDQVIHWANNVRDMSYDIEDVVDGFLVHIEHASNTGFFMGLMQNMFNLFKWGKTHNPIRDTIKDIKKQVKDAADRRRKCKVDEVVANVAVVTTIDPRISAIYKDQKELVGIKEPRNELIKWLSDKEGGGDVSKKQLKIVSIVGFGGLGKTTLAKAVYDKLQSQFYPMVFVPVGRNPNVKKVFEAILHELGYGFNALNLNEMQLINKIRELLQNKRYFIVIDDIWDSSAWDIIKCALTNDNCGSGVLTTTRIRSVADDCCIHSRGYVYMMKPLNNQDSRKLFVSRIFGNHDDLKDMEQILDLSYMHLPHHLKTCLLDIGKYREDQEIEKDYLLRQWIAQEFVSTTSVRDAEDVAEDYFYKLINMSMIQPWKIDYNDEVLSCKVHDIMLDLIRSKVAEENFSLIIDGPEVVIREHKRVRRVSIYYNGEDDGEILEAISGPLSHVRSILLFRGPLVPSFLVLKYVRVLHLEDERCERLDLTGICGLFLLRYLKIFCCRIHLILPSKIGELRQLETVEVEGQYKPTSLPSDIVTLPRLSHLSYSNGLVLPDGIGKLKSLRTLRGAAFLESSVDNIKGLGELTNLRELEMFSELRFYNEEDELEWKMHIDALRSSIGKLSNTLRSLYIGERCPIVPLVHGWSSTLTPPRRLRKLDLTGCEFQGIPEWIAQLHELYSLTIFVREVADFVSIVAGLRSLAHLELRGLMYGLSKREKWVIINARAFGALKHLELYCPYVSLVFEAGAMPNLEKLGICFRFFISAELLPVGIEHLPAGTLRDIHLTLASNGNEVVASQFEQHKAAVGMLLKSAFEAHHPAADVTIDFDNVLKRLMQSL
ncbi:unnamed protein product [Triticum turgidum subsp. durum]|uniref:non-specific serine/threonine protein kinase n=1 Tax=Triticum turgidum subsp. durum TaxID=4567 RepID=A0A9R1SAI6_TRITD|nr:unnamed protein product [Triticum turgidum subsp. durum]